MNVKSIILVTLFASLTVFGESQTNVLVVTESKSPIRAAQSRPSSMKEMRERMEKMAKEDPQRFAQITNRMVRWRQRRAERANAKLDFLEVIDVSRMTDEQKKMHNEYKRLIRVREELEEKMHNPEMTDKDRGDISRDMRETDNVIRIRAKQERRILMLKEFELLGFLGEKATNMCERMEKIINVTDSRIGFGVSPPLTDDGPGGPR